MKFDDMAKIKLEPKEFTECMDDALNTPTKDLISKELEPLIKAGLKRKYVQVSRTCFANKLSPGGKNDYIIVYSESFDAWFRFKWNKDGKRSIRYDGSSNTRRQFRDLMYEFIGIWDEDVPPHEICILLESLGIEDNSDTDVLMNSMFTSFLFDVLIRC